VRLYPRRNDDGHSLHQDMSDLYDGSVMDEAYRLEMSEKLGTGFNVPSCTECTEEEKRRLEQSRLSS
jgi:hypothetical protein